MKAILEFNLPEDKQDFNLASQGSDWFFVAWKMDQWLRGQMKHPAGDMSDDTYEAFQKCREQLRELIHDSNLNLDQQ
jgi:hypothetical protein